MHHEFRRQSQFSRHFGKKQRPDSNQRKPRTFSPAAHSDFRLIGFDKPPDTRQDECRHAQREIQSFKIRSFFKLRPFQTQAEASALAIAKLLFVAHASVIKPDNLGNRRFQVRRKPPDFLRCSYPHADQPDFTFPSTLNLTIPKSRNSPRRNGSLPNNVRSPLISTKTSLCQRTTKCCFKFFSTKSDATR